MCRHMRKHTIQSLFSLPLNFVWIDFFAFLSVCFVCSFYFGKLNFSSKTELTIVNDAAMILLCLFLVEPVGGVPAYESVGNLVQLSGEASAPLLALHLL